MDQTPVPNTYNLRKTLEIVGRRIFYVRKSTNNMKHASFAMTVTASGKISKPLIIAKGTCNGPIVQRKPPSYDNGMINLCHQANAWMDKDAIVWVDQVLCPHHIESAPPDVLPIIF
jgi:hypothetical protein